MVNSRRWKRLEKGRAGWVSRTVHVVPSVEPCSVQSRGSRPGVSFADVIAYFTTTAGADSRYCSQTGAATVGRLNCSHFEDESPSAAFSLTSLGAFSPLAVIWLMVSLTLPG